VKYRDSGQNLIAHEKCMHLAESSSTQDSQNFSTPCKGRPQGSSVEAPLPPGRRVCFPGDRTNFPAAPAGRGFPGVERIPPERRGAGYLLYQRRPGRAARRRGNPQAESTKIARPGDEEGGLQTSGVSKSEGFPLESEHTFKGLKSTRGRWISICPG